jgi:hexosaminidase
MNPGGDSLSLRLPPLVPRPRRLLIGEGRFLGGPDPGCWAEAAAAPVVAQLQAWWHASAAALGLADREQAGIRFLSDPDMAPESYRLLITPTGIRLTAAGLEGWSHALRTLVQLAPAGPAAGWPAVEIHDQPHFAWRGLLLDCCRTFIRKPAILRLLDQMAALKLNRLHWHLTDDQGWRVEIKRYPRLTGVGAWRTRAGVREGGFYSQEDVREIVAYAAERGIAIMPEIELPGHATAALAAYPELGCGKAPLEVATEWGIFPHNYNAGDDRVFEFLEGVMDEVMTLFPFACIHIGADECKKDVWKTCPDCQRRMAENNLADEFALQAYFVNRMAGYLLRHGRIPVAWDEVLEGRCAEGLMVQCWRDEHIIRLALERGCPVIAAPRRYCYFDLAVSQVDLADVYAFDPSMGLPPAANGVAVTGGEATLWTEFIAEHELDHMLFPRALALAETLWSGPQAKAPWPDFLARARGLGEWMRRAGIEMGPALRTDVPAASMKGRTDLHVSPEGLDKLGLGGAAVQD